MKSQYLALAFFVSGGLYAVPLSFDGGEGSPFSVSFFGRIDYAVTTSYSNKGLAFQFGSAGSPFIGLPSSATASIDGMFFSINGGPTQYRLEGIIRKRFVGSGSISLESIDQVTIYAGDFITLYGGAATTTQNIFASVPLDGEYRTILLTSTGLLVSDKLGVYSAIPEPSSITLFAGLAIFCLGATRRPKKG